jgi:hypothetical protein
MHLPSFASILVGSEFLIRSFYVHAVLFLEVHVLNTHA